MPRSPKPAYLYHRKARGNRKAVYVIRDGLYELSTRTGCRQQAEEALKHYLIEKHRRKHAVPEDQLRVSDILSFYAETHAPKTADPERIGYAIDALLPFWEDLFISEVTEETRKRAHNTLSIGAQGYLTSLG